MRWSINKFYLTLVLLRLAFVSFPDYGDYLESFIPEVKKIFALAFSISSIELHTANLDMEPEFLQSFLETLPSHGELKAFSLVTAKDTPLMFVTISGLMYRNPNLVGMRQVQRALSSCRRVLS